MNSALFKQHIERITREAKDALVESGFDAVAIHAGRQEYYRADDREIHFKPYPHFARFTPTSGPGHAILITLKDERPTLLEYRPDDYWYEQGDASDPFWRGALTIVTATSEEGLREELRTRTQGLTLATLGSATPEPEALVGALDLSRAVKTEYEIAMIEEANRISATGHIKARELFLAGASEREIHYGYLTAMGALESEIPYIDIVALNEKGATLHYQRKRADTRQGATFLIDAGASAQGYASDVTRTYAGPKADPLFVQILKGLDALQQKLCAQATPGTHFIELHHEAHLGVANILSEAGVITGSPAAALEAGITHAFLPHGLGHMLGLQVHDVGNRTDEGTAHPLTTLYPKLRTNRRLDTGLVTTIEPGIYFIDSLLKAIKNGPHQNLIDWARVDLLMPMGGIRIEDNVVVATEPKNLTRLYLP